MEYKYLINNQKLTTIGKHDVRPLLNKWLTQDEWKSFLFGDDEAGDAKCFYIMSFLCRYSALSLRVADNGSDVATIPYAPFFELPEKNLPESLRLNRFTFLKSAEGELRIESANSKIEVSVFTPEFTNCLIDLCSAKGVDTRHLAAGSVLHHLFSALLEIGFIESTGAADSHPEWEFHDRLLFARTTGGFTSRILGKRDEPDPQIHQLPVAYSIDTQNVISLQAVSAETANKKDISFYNLLQNRRSRRDFTAVEMPLQTLSDFLTMSVKTERTDASTGIYFNEKHYEDEVSLEPSPSGGARHPLEVYLLARKVSGIPAGMYHYNKLNHSLERCNSDLGKLDAALKKNTFAFLNKQEAPQVEIVVSCRMARTSFKYTNIAYRLILQELGCMYQTMMLSAEYLHLQSCIIGCINAETWQPVCNISHDEELVGQYSLGM